MIDVTVKVPEEYLGEFYEVFGRWLAEKQHGVDEGLTGSATDLVVGADTLEEEGWTNADDDVPLARVVWQKLSPRAAAMFSLLMDHPGHKISGDDLAATLDIPNGKYGIAGVLAWPGRHCAAVNRLPLWQWEYGPPGGSASYWVDQEVADLFKRVR